MKKQESRSKQYFCKICFKSITRGSISGLCRSCALKNRYKEYPMLRTRLSLRWKTNQNPSRNRNLAGKNNPSYIHGNCLKTYFCIDCFKQLVYYIHMTGRCGSCSKKYFYKNPENHPNYIDGRSFLSYSNQFVKIRRNILDRDNHTCQNCNIIEKDYFQLHHVGLDVHHIDYDKSNNDFYNLITLCHNCNIKANYDRIFWKKFYLNKTKLFKSEE
jgi:hypothetical protein